MNNQIFATTNFASHILDWYDENRRILPWRAAPGETVDPYHVWLSEIMLQQTTVVTVAPYFQKFLDRWPRVENLAAAPLDDILTAWAGLGYYARARNLHKCAQTVCQDFGGRFPSSEEDLLKLPGVGAYTAAAIASIAFGNRAVVVDGNIERIVSRYFRIQEVLPKSRTEIRDRADQLTPDRRAGDYAQALMDIGSTVCKPKAPLCDECPVASGCHAQKEGDQLQYPKKAPKKKKPEKRANILWIENQSGQILMRRREEKGLLGGMMEFPSTEWSEEQTVDAENTRLLSDLGLNLHLSLKTGAPTIKHTFTHFHLFLTPYQCSLEKEERVLSNSLIWVDPQDLEKIALPTLMMKVVKSVKSRQGSLAL